MTDDHAPSHEEIYEMAVQDKEEEMDIKVLSEAATSGPWEVVHVPYGHIIHGPNMSFIAELTDPEADTTQQLHADALLIVNAINALRSGELLSRDELSAPAIKSVTFDEIRAAVDRGELRPTSADSPEPDLPDGFWDGAEKMPPLSPVVAVKPLDLSNLLKHAFLAGYEDCGSRFTLEDVMNQGAQDFLEYDPTENAAYKRILSQVEAQPTWRGMDSAASEVDALNARVAELEGLCEKWIDLATRHIDEYGMKFDVNRMADFWQGLDETRAALPTPPSEGA